MNKVIKKAEQLLEYHNLIYITHIFIVAPLLLLVSYLCLEESKFTMKQTPTGKEFLLLIQGSFGILVFLYHSWKLYSSLI